MKEDIARQVFMSMRPTHGTATPVEFPSVIPADKRDLEVFWVNALLSSLPELRSLQAIAALCIDDSHGNHDVMIELNDGQSIGVQVTELTYELERARQAQRARFLAECRKCLGDRGMSVSGQLLVKCFVPFMADRRYIVPRPEVLVDAVAAFLNESRQDQQIELDSVKVWLEWIEKGSLYVPDVNGIGIDCDLDALPRTLDMYRSAVSYLRERKAESVSPWLLIWSQSFWRDKHWLGDEVLEYMRAAFLDSHFDRVFFMESIGGQVFFEPNLSIHVVKP